jgi:hypothetical protein
MNEKVPRNTTPTKIGRSEINHERSESAKKPQRSSNLEINTPATARKIIANASNQINAKT